MTWQCFEVRIIVPNITFCSYVCLFVEWWGEQRNECCHMLEWSTKGWKEWIAFRRECRNWYMCSSIIHIKNPLNLFHCLINMHSVNILLIDLIILWNVSGKCYVIFLAKCNHIQPISLKLTFQLSVNDKTNTWGGNIGAILIKSPTPGVKKMS